MKRYLDSNLFLNPILYSDAKAERCKRIIKEILQNEGEIVTSVLTWDEVTYVVEKKLGKIIAIKEGKNFLSFPKLKIFDVNKNILIRAQKIVEKYRLKPRDAIHAATALASGCTEIISDDSDFDSVKEIKRIPFESF